MKNLSIIIPTLNEAENIGKLLQYLKANTTSDSVQIIVADGGSTDDTVLIAKSLKIKVLEYNKGRSIQMNRAASIAEGDVFYFVHADTFPPPDFFKQIAEALQNGKQVGCFRFKFDSNRWLLKINAFFTRFPFLWCRGGDQTLFVTKTLYESLGGFNEQLYIMEEYDFIKRAQKTTPFIILKDNVLVSARKYDNNNYLRVQLANLIVFNMFRFGFSQAQMINTYRKILNTKGLSWGSK